MRCGRCNKRVEYQGNENYNVSIAINYVSGMRRLRHKVLCQECSDLVFEFIDTFCNYQDKADVLQYPYAQ